MTDAERLAALLAAVRPLLDRENVQPFYSAWEFDHGLDGMEVYASLERAYQAATAHSGEALMFEWRPAYTDEEWTTGPMPARGTYEVRPARRFYPPDPGPWSSSEFFTAP